MDTTTFDLLLFFSLIVLLFDLLLIHLVEDEIMHEELVLGYREQKERKKERHRILKENRKKTKLLLV